MREYLCIPSYLDLEIPFSSYTISYPILSFSYISNTDHSFTSSLLLKQLVCIINEIQSLRSSFDIFVVSFPFGHNVQLAGS